MKTDDLITTLSSQPALPPLRSGPQVGALLAVMVISAGVFLAVAGPRDGLPGLLMQPLIATKTLLPALLCLIGLPPLMALLYPEGRIAHPLRLALPLALAAGLWGFGFVTLPDAARFAQFTPLAIVECVGLILVIAALPLWVALRLAARGAPTRPALTGALAGLVVGAGAAAGYSFFCLQDNPLFYVTWYGTAIGLTTAAGAWLGARRLRW
ncbi:NrsF family protein [Paracoccus sp. (in: a-proteobacteria)]|uniref:NrsF family protein n=1 Tax=Paracoccus sp. TaxID=267 RepID=UPI0035B31FE4